MATAALHSLTDTWNAGGTTYTAIKMDVTDTASAAGSLLLDLQVGGSSKFSVGKGGALTTVGGPVSLVASSLFISPSGNTSLWDAAAFGWTSTSSANGTLDTILRRDAANTLALRNGTNAQILRWYHTYTDGANNQFGALRTAVGYVEMAAVTNGSGADDIDVLLTPAGTGAVRFGTHSAIAAETITGYITIKDSGGALRKVAVVS